MSCLCERTASFLSSRLLSLSVCVREQPPFCPVGYSHFLFVWKNSLFLSCNLLSLPFCFTGQHGLAKRADHRLRHQHDFLGGRQPGLHRHGRNRWQSAAHSHKSQLPGAARVCHDHFRKPLVLDRLGEGLHHVRRQVFRQQHQEPDHPAPSPHGHTGGAPAEAGQRWDSCEMGVEDGSCTGLATLLLTQM